MWPEANNWKRNREAKGQLSREGPVAEPGRPARLPLAWCSAYSGRFIRGRECPVCHLSLCWAWAEKLQSRLLGCPSVKRLHPPVALSPLRSEGQTTRCRKGTARAALPAARGRVLASRRGAVKRRGARRLDCTRAPEPGAPGSALARLALDFEAEINYCIARGPVPLLNADDC